MLPKEVVFAVYGAALLGLWLKVGFSALCVVILFGPVPVILLLAWYSEELAPFTGLIDKGVAEEDKREVRRAEKEVFRELLAKKGGESMEWMNFLIERMWPHIARYAEGVIRGMEETIQKSVPVGIHFKTVSLGKEAFRFGPVTPRTVGCYYDDKFLAQGGVEFQIGFNYHSDCEIILATKFATVGAACLDIAGTLSVLFRPLHGEAPPFFGGIEVLFTNPPVVDMDFKGIGNFADMPGVYGTVRRIIDDAIAGAMVMPNRWAMQMTDSDKVDLARLKCPIPEGILRIKVVRAEKLAGMDFHVLGKATSDPYVQIKVGGDFWKTPTIMKTCDPVWTQDNAHDFVVYSKEQAVFIDCLDWDHFKADDPLGSVMVHNEGVSRRITAKELIRLAREDGPTSFRLYKASAKEGAPPKESRLFLEVEWLRLQLPLAGPTLVSPDVGSNKYVVTLKVDECKGMPENGLNAPFTVRLGLKGSEITKESNAGWSKWSNTMNLTTLDTIRKLSANKCSSDVIADILHVELALIKDFIAYDKSSLRNGTNKQERNKEDEACLAKLDKSRTARQITLNPQFEEVLLLTLPGKDITAVVEILDCPSKRPKHHGKKPEADAGMVACFEVSLGSQEVTRGPFKLLDPRTKAQLNGKATLEGTFTMYRLEKAKVRPEKLKLKAVSRMVGLAARIVKPHSTYSGGSGGAGSPSRRNTVNGEASDASPTPASPFAAAGQKVGKMDKFFKKIDHVLRLPKKEDSPERRQPSSSSSLPERRQPFLPSSPFSPFRCCTVSRPELQRPLLSSRSVRPVPHLNVDVEEEHSGASPAAPAAASEPVRHSTLAEHGKTVAEEVVDLVESSEGMYVLFGLGLLRNAQDWDGARKLYKRKYGWGKGRGDLVTALELELCSKADRAKAAQMLQVNGIGTGEWPPPRRFAPETESADAFVGCSTATVLAFS